MSLSLDKIERLAPDQASLSAAKKLLNSTVWSTLEEDGRGLIWGECQGSGSTPYRIAVTEADAGYKCTCPSRKFPCKHALALMWMRADGSPNFASGAPPPWVDDWLGRRRGPAPAKPVKADEAPRETPSIAALADEAEVSADADPVAQARAEAQRARNRAQREALIAEGIAAMDRWIEDQLQRGLAGFDQRAAQECGTLSRRLVDAKAGGLANRIALLPGQLFALEEAHRGSYAAQALATLYIVGQAYLRQDRFSEALRADVRQLVGWNLNRETLLEDPVAIRGEGPWRVLATREDVQPDRLRRIETWLERAQGEPRFAVLIDFVPLAGGAGGNLYLPGEMLDATLVFYPSPVPLRAQIVSHRSTTKAPEHWKGQAVALAEALTLWQVALAQKPWLDDWPLAASAVSLRAAGGELYVASGNCALPISAGSRDAARTLLGLDDITVFGIWNGHAFVPMLAETPLGEWGAA